MEWIYGYTESNPRETLITCQMCNLISGLILPWNIHPDISIMLLCTVNTCHSKPEKVTDMFKRLKVSNGLLFVLFLFFYCN